MFSLFLWTCWNSNWKKLIFNYKLVTSWVLTLSLLLKNISEIHSLFSIFGLIHTNFGQVRKLMFVGVKFRSCSNINVCQHEICLIKFKPIFGHIDSVKWTSLLLSVIHKPFLLMHIGSLQISITKPFTNWDVWLPHIFVLLQFCELWYICDMKYFQLMLTEWLKQQGEQKQREGRIHWTHDDHRFSM